MKSESFYKKLVSGFLRLNPEEVELFKPRYINEGVKSTVKEVFCRQRVEVIHEEKMLKDRLYILKVYNDSIDLSSKPNSLEEFVKEKVLLENLKNCMHDGKPAVPEILTFKEKNFDKEKAILMKVINVPTLEDCVNMRSILGEYPHYILLNHPLELLSEIILETNKKKEDIQRGLLEASGGKVTLNRKLCKDYHESLENYFEILGKRGYPVEKFEGFRKNFPLLAHFFLANKDHSVIMPSDVYPSNITLTSMLDFGTTDYTSLNLVLGCTAGFQTVFDSLGKELREKREYFIRERLGDFWYGKKSPIENKPRELDIESGFYVGAVYGNIRVAAGIAKRNPKKVKKIKNILATAKEQEEILRKRFY